MAGLSLGILNPAVYTNSVYQLMLNKFSRRLRPGGGISFQGGFPPGRCLDETLNSVDDDEYRVSIFRD